MPLFLLFEIFKVGFGLNLSCNGYADIKVLNAVSGAVEDVVVINTELTNPTYRGPAGPQGPQGIPGPQGPEGPVGKTGPAGP